MSAALALLTDCAGMEVRVVATCCGGHLPASECLCCAECVTNSDVQRQTLLVRASAARAVREATALRRARIVSCQRWLWRTEVRMLLELRVHELDVALHRAAKVPDVPTRPLVPELDALGCGGSLSMWFRRVTS